MAQLGRLEHALARQVERERAVTVVGVLCAEQSRGSVQCNVRVKGKRADRIIGVAVNGSKDWSEYSVGTSWSAGTIKKTP